MQEMSVIIVTQGKIECRLTVREEQGVQLHPLIFEEDQNCALQFWESSFGVVQNYVDKILAFFDHLPTPSWHFWTNFIQFM